MTDSNLPRRDFLKYASAAGLSLLLPLGKAAGQAASSGYRGPYWITLHAGGGWDPLFFCDPKANPSFNAVTQTVGSIGPFSFAANNPDASTLLNVPAANASQYTPYLLSNEAFFQKWGSRALVLNGINTGTNNHDAGTANTWSGQNQNYPALAALIAGTYGPSVPLAFISSGGYDTSLDLVALSRVSGADAVARIARPNLLDPSNPNSFIQLPSGFARMQHAQADRLARMQQGNLMVRASRGQAALALAHGGSGQLANVTFPTTQNNLPNGLGDMQGLFDQTQLVMAAFQAGVAVSASMSIGGFDTHANHDMQQSLQMAKILGCVDFIMGQIEALGLSDSTYLLVGSEFGRGPQYNMNRGKDHWPVTSMLMFGPQIAGNRVVGATDAQQQPLTLNATTLRPDPNGVYLSPTLINKALRSLSKTTGSPADKEYPLEGVNLNLFS